MNFDEDLHLQLENESEVVPCGLEDLPPSVPRYRYRGSEDFGAFWADSLSDIPRDSEVLLVTGLDKLAFEDDFVNIDKREYRKACKEYCYASEILLVTKPTAEIAIAGGFFSSSYSILSLSLHENRLICMGNARQIIGASLKCPDSSLCPRHRLRDGYPSVVLEVNWSEFAAKLGTDAKHWLMESKGEVKGVVTILLDMNKKDITIRMLCMENDEPVIRHETLIRASIGRCRSSEPTFEVLNAPFVIPYEVLFLVPPKPGTSEGDVEVTDPELVRFASGVWSSQR